jgi:hypothetical protein
MQDLGSLGSRSGGGGALGINGSGEIVGVSAIFKHPEEPFSWTSTGGMKDLLPHHIYVDGSAQAVNRLGNIAGWVDTATNSYPALWTAGGLRVLSTLGGPNAIASRSTARIKWSATLERRAAPTMHFSGIRPPE